MSKPNILIRKATQNDALMIAEAVGMAIGDGSVQGYCGENWLNVLAEVARLESSQYSYNNAFIAEVDGTLAGAIVGYDGAQLPTLREQTLAIINKYNKIDVTIDETEPGEYYLDSLYVRPEYRKIGVASKLIATFCQNAFNNGHQQVGLIVDFDNPSAEQLYTQIGFRRVGQRTFFGHQMWHLVYFQR